MNWKRTRLSGWGRAPVATVEACRPERRAEVPRVLGEGGRTLIPFGAGRSYGDAALNDGGGVIRTERLDRFLDFDRGTGLLVSEPGVTFRDLLDVFLPRGFFAPVSPGTSFATLGGAVANDVHGKNHESAGGFGDHVAWLDLALPSGEVVRVSPDRDPELFRATVGGVGLTGCVVALALRLARVPSGRVRVRERRIPDLDAFLAAFEGVRHSATFSVGWVDALASGPALGRGILETAEFEPPAEDGGDRGRGGEAGEPAPRRIGLPFALPGALLNRRTVGLFNRLYHARVPEGGRERVLPLGAFLYPLDAIEGWNRLYGPSGFHQFQCALPDAQAPRGLRALLETISAAGSASFLAVLKTLGGEGAGHLSFPLRGYTLALDFPVRPGTRELLGRLERIALEHGGRVYLAKDACLSPQAFRRMYPRLDAFREVLRRVDPGRRMMSDLARRLDLHGDP
jgi:decaprenylphospho-beta-D-ribofuranose 2-oxidase